jgi:hypothetical protein
MFEAIESEHELISGNVISGNDIILNEWLGVVVPMISSVSLKVPVKNVNGSLKPTCAAELGGRRGTHTPHLKSLVDDLQKVYSIAPEAKW